MARQTFTIAERIVQIMDKLAKEESWLEHYYAMGVAAPQTQEANVAALRAELASLREKAELRS